MDADGGNYLSMSGRPLKEILNEVKQQAAHIERGALIIQGGGTDLMARSAEDTAKLIVDTIRQVKAKKKDLRVGFVGILRRPRESLAYELRRRRVNKRVGEELGNLKADLAKIKDIGVSFLDLDEQLPGNYFGRDRVHLNEDGQKRLGERLMEWVRTTENILRRRTAQQMTTPKAEESETGGECEVIGAGASEVDTPSSSPASEEQGSGTSVEEMDSPLVVATEGARHAGSSQ